VGRDVDEDFIEAAVERYRLIDAQLAAFTKACATMEVTVRSPDGLVTVTVTLDGTVRDVHIEERLLGESAQDVSTSVRLAVTAAADAAAWGRQKLQSETFADYVPVGRG
jgi:DNA-binding protein YbaB